MGQSGPAHWLHFIMEKLKILAWTGPYRPVETRLKSVDTFVCALIMLKSEFVCVCIITRYKDNFGSK